jgi:hypothetical protein
LIDAGDFAAADARLADAEQRDLNSAIEQEENAKRKRLSAAASRCSTSPTAMPPIIMRKLPIFPRRWKLWRSVGGG